MNQLLKDNTETIEIVCDSFGWKMNRIRQYKRASEINDGMCVFLEEIKIILMNHKDELMKINERKDEAEKTLAFNKIKLEILKMETWHKTPIETMINLFANKWNDEDLRMELLIYLNKFGKC